mmetsp:Transcript_20821/g.41653  ORF Transcript_20821/g.41653 Transcript_20821/m.41653 type:complete len:403 (-) Transcript_20821:108-1316(-)
MRLEVHREVGTDELPAVIPRGLFRIRLVIGMGKHLRHPYGEHVVLRKSVDEVALSVRGIEEDHRPLFGSHVRNPPRVRVVRVPPPPVPIGGPVLAVVIVDVHGGDERRPPQLEAGAVAVPPHLLDGGDALGPRTFSPRPRGPRRPDFPRDRPLQAEKIPVLLLSRQRQPGVEGVPGPAVVLQRRQRRGEPVVRLYVRRVRRGRAPRGVPRVAPVAQTEVAEGRVRVHPRQIPVELRTGVPPVVVAVQILHPAVVLHRRHPGAPPGALLVLDHGLAVEPHIFHGVGLPLRKLRVAALLRGGHQHLRRGRPVALAHQRHEGVAEAAALHLLHGAAEDGREEFLVANPGQVLLALALAPAVRVGERVVDRGVEQLAGGVLVVVDAGRGHHGREFAARVRLGEGSG